MGHSKDFTASTSYTVIGHSFRNARLSRQLLREMMTICCSKLYSNNGLEEVYAIQVVLKFLTILDYITAEAQRGIFQCIFYNIIRMLLVSSADESIIENSFILVTKNRYRTHVSNLRSSPSLVVYEIQLQTWHVHQVCNT